MLKFTSTFTKNVYHLILVALAAIIFLNGCGMGRPDPSALGEPIEETVLPVSVVSATGVVLPRNFAILSMKSPGMVAQVLVEEGDTVQAGQVLVRLEGGDPENPSMEWKALIQARELEVDAAQVALDNLEEQAASIRLQAEQVLSSTVSQIRDLQYLLEELELPEMQKNLSPLEGYEAALAEYTAALETYEPYRDEADSSERQERKQDLDEARENYDTAVSRLQLSLSLEIAMSRQNQAMEDLQKYQDGPSEDEVRQARKQLESAKTSLEATRSSTSSLVLAAPFSGTISEVALKVGQFSAPGSPAVVMADFSEYYIETTDLNEIDMIRISPGDPVQITFDAMPDQMIEGKVVSIANQASPGAGVYYKVRISLNTLPPGLRWGMSAFVDILPQK
jgi:HlyD family secretion protein